MNVADRIRYLGHELLPPAAVKTGRGIARKILNANRPAVDQELARLGKLPNGQRTITSIFGEPFTTFDGPSFAHQYDLFFIKQFYSFDCSTDAPYIVDCGANMGVSVRWWKSQYPKARVVAFEPDPELFDMLQMNCSDLRGVELINAAVWNNDGKVQFAATGGEGGHISEGNTASCEMPTVSTVRLRSFLNEKCDFLKMDIEGAEAEVIRDSVDALHNVDRAFIEYHSLVGRPQRLAETITHLESAGFRLYAHTELPSERPFRQLVTFNGKELRLDLFCYRDGTRPSLKSWPPNGTKASSPN